MIRLTIIDDLSIAFKDLGFSIKQYEDEIRNEIVLPFREAINEFFEDIIFIPLDNIRNKTNMKSRNNLYIVTLDDGLYFPDFNFSLSLTRTATNVSSFRNGPYILHPRNGSPSLENQVITLSEDYNRNITSKSIVICDDSIGKYGLTIKRVIELLNKHDLIVNLIFVLVNSHRKESISGIKIDSIFLDTYFINERDLYWGLPLSGISCLKDSQMLGVPTTIDFETIRNRIYPLSPEKLIGFRKCVLDFNIKFWTLLENYSNHHIYFYDCPRLQGLPAFLGFQNCRIINFLNDINMPINEISFNDNY